MRTTDYTGYQVGRLTAIRYVGKAKDGHHSAWECKCACGNTVVLSSSKLKSRTIFSCGCLRKELARGKTPYANERRGEIDGTVLAMLKGEQPYLSNSTGYRGVSYNKSLGKYTAQICFKRKKYHLGVFADPEQAHQAYLLAKEEIHLAFLEANDGPGDSRSGDAP